MIIFKQQAQLSQYIDNQLDKGLSIGFVPTMGALHDGHISLVNESKKTCAVTICSIFVNPTQFNNQSDFDKYPITIDQDVALLSAAQCDILYLPTVSDIYPDGVQALKHYDLAGMDLVLEGKFRPGHFQGVANVVHRLLLATKAQHLYMGAKDFQQCKVVGRLIKIEGLTTQLHICPTLRANSGLAMSSRNARLSELGKQNAAVIYEGLQMVAAGAGTQTFEVLAAAYAAMLASKHLELEHLILLDSDTLDKLANFDQTKHMALVTAAMCEGVRLIDNLVIGA
jgi:pantoate--beta-alanine ligase